MPTTVLDASALTERAACPACGSERHRRLGADTVFPNHWRFPKRDVMLADADRERREARACDGCGLWYFSLIPSLAVIGEVTDEEGVQERWEVTDRPAFERARRRLERLDSGAILDIGAHTGGFLAGVPAGWTKAALEPMAGSAGRIGDCEVIAGFAETADLGSERFDVVTAFDVFEHFESPLLAMERLVRSMRPGGLLMIETGTTDARWARLLGPGWYYLQFLEHFQAFNERSLRSLCTRFGLEVTEVERVHQTAVTSSVKARSAVSASLYAAATGAGRKAALWRRANDLLRPASGGLPPSTLGIDRDHLFVVARRSA